MSDKKGTEVNHLSDHSIILHVQMQAGGPGKIRDIETEELIEDQQQVSHSPYVLQNTIFFLFCQKKIAANPGA